MKPIKTRKRRMAARTDDGALRVALKISSLMVWAFYSFAALYVAYCNSFFLEDDHQLLAAQSVVGHSTPKSLLQKVQLSHKYSKYYYYFFPDGFDIAAFMPLVIRVVAFSLAATAATFYFANQYGSGGEMLMFVAWLIGVLSERYWLTAPVSLGAIATTATASTSAASAVASSVASSVASTVIKNATNAAAAAAAAASSSASASASASAGGSDVVVMYDHRIPTVPSWLWLVVSIGTGFFCGLMAKVKDIADGKVDRGHHLLSMLEDEDGSTVAARIDDVRVLQKTAADDETAGDAGPATAVATSSTRTGALGKRHASDTATTTSTGGGGMEGVRTVTTRRRRNRAARGFGSRFVAIGERLYIVIPFCTGQWFAFILRHGWRGIFIENCVLVLTLGMIGYTMLSFKLLREQVYRTSGRTTVVRYRRTVPIGENGNEVATVVEEDEVETTVDLIDLISKIFTTSFGAVGVGVVAVNVFITMLAIPFLKTLVKLNALVSSVGILVELFVYEMA